MGGQRRGPALRGPRCHLDPHRSHREAGRQRRRTRGGERLLVDPRDSGTLWLGTRHDGLLKSSDRGATWAVASGFPATASASGQGVTFLVAVGRAVYAGWGDGDGTATAVNLYRTTDGTTWEPVPGQPTGTSAKVPIRAAHDRHTRELYVTYADAPGS